MQAKSFNDICSVYLKKYAFQATSIIEPIAENTNLIVTIPCFNESYLTQTLDSLAACDATVGTTEVIVMFNGSEKNGKNVVEQNQNSIKAFDDWVFNYKGSLRFHKIVHLELPKKHAGVGLARKIVMDEAVARFQSINKDGVIVCFDADSIVESNYLKVIEQSFENNEVGGASIHFAHPYENMEDAVLQNGIIQYELHLRYYVNALRYCNYPFAFHTIGSSMACKTSIYCKVAGMNRRKAGEDFYFLHKIIPSTKFIDITETQVIPSPRISDRVPFGTGRAQMQWKESRETVLETYNPDIFKEIKVFVDGVGTLCECKQEDSIRAFVKNQTPGIQSYLNENEFVESILETHKYTNSTDTFYKRFWNWLDGFRMLKIVHFLRDEYYSNTTIQSASNDLLEMLGHKKEEGVIDLLERYKQIDQTITES